MLTPWSGNGRWGRVLTGTRCHYSMNFMGMPHAWGTFDVFFWWAVAEGETAAGWDCFEGRRWVVQNVQSVPRE